MTSGSFQIDFVHIDLASKIFVIAKVTCAFDLLIDMDFDLRLDLVAILGIFMFILDAISDGNLGLVSDKQNGRNESRSWVKILAGATSVDVTDVKLLNAEMSTPPEAIAFVPA